MVNFFELIDETNKLIQQFIDNYNRILDLYLKHNVSQYQVIKDTIELSKGSAPQRTEEWYKLRGTCITASDVGAFLGMDKYKSQKKAIEAKSGLIKTHYGNKYTSWGNKYEEIASKIYEKMFNVKIYEAPLLIHPIYPFIGASCDGFVVDEKNKHGYLIEIKCPLARKLTDTVPEHYISQPRTQMEVVKADRCDFFECKLEEYDNHHEFIADRSTDYKGFIISYGFFHEVDSNGISKQYYLYPDDIFDKDHNPLMEKARNIENSIHVKPIFWKLVEYRNHTIERDPQWLKDNIRTLEDCWDKINEKKLASLTF